MRRDWKIYTGQVLFITHTCLYEAPEPPEMQAAKSDQTHFESTESQKYKRQRAARTHFRALNRQNYKRHGAQKPKNELVSTERPEIQAAAANSTNLTKMYCQKYKQKVATRPNKKDFEQFLLL